MKTINNKKLLLISSIFTVFLLLVLSCACSANNEVQMGKFPNEVAENAKVSDKYKDTANEMTDFTIKEFTENISKIPHKSGEVQQINDYVYNWGIQHNIKTSKDQSGCIYYDVPATEGYETYPTIILQAHTDMVQTTADDSINMNTTPIDIVMDEQTKGLHSKDYKTNIGADDAEGVAALMNFAINKNYKHGPLRCLFTYDEETTMEGAIRLSPEVLNSDYLLNIDSGPVGSACVSSAGVMHITFNKQYTLVPSKLKSKISVSIKDLAGGHSGTEIAKSRMSANVLTAKLLQKFIDENIYFELISIDGGKTTNVISTSANFEILVNDSDVEKANKILNDEFSSQKKNNPDDKDAKIEIREEQVSGILAMSNTDSQKLVEALNTMPHGCREKSEEFKDNPAVSSNFGILTLKDGQLYIAIHSRSNVEGKNEELDASLQQIAKDYDLTYKVINSYGPWAISQDKSIFDLWSKSYNEACNIKAVSYQTHGGLECSRFLEKKPSMKMLSVGMDVADEHAVTETLYTKSIPAFYAGMLYFFENANTL